MQVRAQAQTQTQSCVGQAGGGASQAEAGNLGAETEVGSFLFENRRHYFGARPWWR